MTQTLSCVLIIAVLCTGCATGNVSGAEVLASRIARESPSIRCAPGTVRYCEVIAVDDEKNCACMDYSSFSGRR